MSYQIYCSRSTYFTTELPLSPSLFNANIIKIKVYGYSNKKKNWSGQLVGVGPRGPLQPTDYRLYVSHGSVSVFCVGIGFRFFDQFL